MHIFVPFLFKSYHKPFHRKIPIPGFFPLIADLSNLKLIFVEPVSIAADGFGRAFSFNCWPNDQTVKR